MLIRMTMILRLKHFIFSVRGPDAEELGPNLTLWPAPFLPDCVGLFFPLFLCQKQESQTSPPAPLEENYYFNRKNSDGKP